jgi:LPS export ABC transporter permease LptG/LPS export ABC transporter permease LptF
MRTLDRYLIRETIGPFALALGLFTFLLWVQPMLVVVQTLLSKGVSMGTTAYLLATLLPQALGVTVPMAFLAGIVMALGRFSGDREAVAMMACGVSPLRLIRPMMLMAAVAAGATVYVLVWLMPDANQSFRAVTFDLTQRMASEDIRPRIYYEGFPGRVILIGDRRTDGRWTEVMIADTTVAGRPAIQLAETGALAIDHEARLVNIVLEGVSSYRPQQKDGEYQVQKSGEGVATIDPKTVFGDGAAPNRGFNEMTLAQLDAEAARKVEMGMSPHNEIMFKQQRFAFPLACVVFAVIGVALGVNTRKDGKMAGFAIGIGVIMAYYGINQVFDGQAKGGAFPAFWARWMANIILGVAGLLLLWWRTRGARRSFEIPLPAWLLARLPGAPVPDAPGSGVRASSGRVVLVIKFPPLSLPRPRLMDLYISRRYLRTVLLAFAGLLALYYIGEFIELSEKVSKGNATMAMVGEYFYYATPKFVYFVVPLATLVAVLTTMGALTRTNELTILRACGVSLYRTALPLVLMALVLSGLLFTLEDRVLAHSERRAEVLRNTIRDRPQRTFNVANKSWLIGKDGSLYHYAVFDVRGGVLHHLSIFETAREPYRLTRHTFAKTVTFTDGTWQAVDGWVQTFDANGRVTRQAFNKRELELEPPKSFGTEQIEAQFMNYAELRSYIDTLATSGFRTAEYRVELYRKMAFPFVTLVMTLIAIPFGVTMGRRGALYGIGLAVVLAVAYLLVSTLFLAIGKAELLPAMLAAWSTNILFATAALTLVFTVRT